MNGQPESVWDYPRPPRIEVSGRHLRLVLDGAVIAETRRAQRVLETSHPPVYYVPLADVHAGVLAPSGGRASFCEWKGLASYYDVTGPRGTAIERCAWGYERPAAGYEGLLDTIAFYPGLLEECTVDGERVIAQPGDFYGGWITSEVTGPFKGEPGTQGW